MSDIDASRVEPRDVAAALSSLVDAENPWLGLDSFTEETRRFFFGRDAEIAELARRVQRKLLTVLFGQSGLGKTSILRAGIVPRLRREGYCPVYVRIDYSPDSPEPSEQIKLAIFGATTHWGQWSQPGSAVAGESLWEFLHHRDDVLRDAYGKPLVPLLIFDQFEEIFTLAQDDEFGRKRAAKFMEDLADLVENRPPKSLEAMLDDDDGIAERFDFGRSDYRILLALREDYLAHLEGLKSEMPSITQNRMRLARMTGKQALEAVTKPGGDLVSKEVAEAIVRFVAGDAELANAEVEPALLSLVCSELNNSRIAQGHAAISADLLAGTHDSILHEFYERALADQPPGVRRFIEDEMLTESGYRENIAEERVLRAFSIAGAAPNAIATLVNRRLLRIEERLDMRRVELTHDVLCEVVQQSRDLRQQRETREAVEKQLADQRVREAATRKSLMRARQVAAGCAILAIAAIASALFGYQNMKRAKVAEATAESTHRMAESARGEAEKLITYMLDDLYLELEPVGRLDVVGELSQRALDYYAALPPELRTKETERNRALALVRNGHALGYQGKHADAAKALDEAIDVLGRLQRDGDRSEATAVGLALGLIARGVVFYHVFQGPECGKSAARAIEVVEAPMSMASPSARLRRAHGAALTLFGYCTLDYEMSLKPLERAREAFRAIDGLSLSDLPAAVGFADASSNQAKALLNLGRDTEAGRIAEEGVRVAERILERRPGHMGALRAHMSNLTELAIVERNQLHVVTNLAFSRRIEKDLEEFLKLDPGNTVQWVNLGTSRAETASLLESLGRLSESIAKYGDAVSAGSKANGMETVAAFSSGQLAMLEADMGLDARATRSMEECRRLTQIAAAQMATDQKVPRALASMNPVFSDGYVALNRANFRAAHDSFTKYIGAFEPIEPPNNVQKEERNLVLEAATHGRALASYGLNDLAAAERDMLRSVGHRQALPMRNLKEKVALSDHRIFLAIFVARQGRRAEAVKLIEPELKFQREVVAGGSDDLLQHAMLARAQYAAALASPASAAPLLREAAAIIDGFPAEMKRRKSIAPLRGWIAKSP